MLGRGRVEERGEDPALDVPREERGEGRLGIRLELDVGRERAVGLPHEDGGVVLGWISEQLHAAGDSQRLFTATLYFKR